METKRLQKIEKIKYAVNFEYMRHKWFKIKKIWFVCKLHILSRVSDKLGISCYQEKHHPSVKIKVLINYINTKWSFIVLLYLLNVKSAPWRRFSLNVVVQHRKHGPETKGDTGSRVMCYCSIPYSVRKMLCFVMMFSSMLQFSPFAVWAENFLSD